MSPDHWMRNMFVIPFHHPVFIYQIKLLSPYLSVPSPANLFSDDFLCSGRFVVGGSCLCHTGCVVASDNHILRVPRFQPGNWWAASYFFMTHYDQEHWTTLGDGSGLGSLVATTPCYNEWPWWRFPPDNGIMFVPPRKRRQRNDPFPVHVILMDNFVLRITNS